jgi:hypothetical protein
MQSLQTPKSQLAQIATARSSSYMHEEPPDDEGISAIVDSAALAPAARPPLSRSSSVPASATASSNRRDRTSSRAVSMDPRRRSSWRAQRSAVAASNFSSADSRTDASASVPQIAAEHPFDIRIPSLMTVSNIDPVFLGGNLAERISSLRSLGVRISRLMARYSVLPGRVAALRPQRSQQEPLRQIRDSI